MKKKSTLNLKKTIKNLGAAKLTSLIGMERLESIHAIMQEKITENQLANLLIVRHGTQILSDKRTRNMLLKTLPKWALYFLLNKNSNEQLTEYDLEKLEKSTWSKKSNYTQRLLELFELGDEYLPPLKSKLPSEEIINTKLSLYPYQKRVKDIFIKSLLSGQEKLLLHLPTGSGKTRTCIEGLVDYWRAQGDDDGFMIWLTDSEELCTQAEETFKFLWLIRGDRPINLIRLWGNFKLKELKSKGGIIIASLQKIHRMRMSTKNQDFKLVSEINRRARIIIVDEAHKSIAKTYKATINFLCDIKKTRLVGLTATPGRSNIEQINELVKFYGNTKITLTDEDNNEVDDPIEYLQERNYLSKIIRESIPSDITIDLTTDERKEVSKFFDIPHRILLELSKSNQRNAIIIKETAKLFENDHQIIIFACSVEHAHLLSELLMIRNIPSRCIDGNTNSYDRYKYISDFKSSKINVLVNYGVLTTGFDSPNTNAVIITRPTGSLVLYSQMIGRGIRGPKMGGTDYCTLIDIEDNLIGYPSERFAFKFFDNYWS